VSPDVALGGSPSETVIVVASGAYAEIARQLTAAGLEERRDFWCVTRTAG
jgi:hypothetical protein